MSYSETEIQLSEGLNIIIAPYPIHISGERLFQKCKSYMIVHDDDGHFCSSL